MNDRDTLFLESVFKKYYYDHISEMPAPAHVQRREFGYQKFSTTGMIRHIKFSDPAEMRVRILREAPSDVYYSNAYYGFPEMEMSEKDWRGADLIFDIDAKDLQLPCRKKHALDVCQTCGRATACDDAKHDNAKADGAPDAKSVACDCDNNDDGSSARRVRRKSLPCKKCMDASKSQVRGLAALLCDDLGISREQIMVYFSGNEGFHLHVLESDDGNAKNDSSYRMLDARARANLADYITLKGVMPESVGVHRGKIDKAGIADISDRGWRGRIARAAFKTRTGRDRMISDMAKSPDPYADFEGLLRDAADKAGVRIDPAVTMDVHRVFRMPYTLNGKSGLLKAPCSLDALGSFDPYADAVVLDDTSTITVEADCPLRFKLGGRNVGPYKPGERAEVRACEAAYLVCKGLARLPESDV